MMNKLRGAKKTESWNISGEESYADEDWDGDWSGYNDNSWTASGQQTPTYESNSHNGYSGAASAKPVVSSMPKTPHFPTSGSFASRATSHPADFDDRGLSWETWVKRLWGLKLRHLMNEVAIDELLSGFDDRKELFELLCMQNEFGHASEVFRDLYDRYQSYGL